MTADLRQHLRQFLLKLPAWEIPRQRHTLVAPILRGEPIWDDLDLFDDANTAVERLLSLFAKHGAGPYLVLLNGLREPEGQNEEIDLLVDRLRAIRPARPRQVWTDAPYRGLAFFDLRHAPIFFGRESETEEILRKMTQSCFTVVVGASGSGKSSLVRAGVWPRLAATKQWFVQAMTPLEMDNPAASFRASFVSACKDQDGFESKRSLAKDLEHEPIASIADRLLPKGKDYRWLLILDQMEELFATGRKEAAAAWLDRLLEATRPLASGQPSRFQVLATLRSDLFHHILDHPPLKRAVGREGGQHLLSVPGRLDIERMVSGPLMELELPVPWALDAALPSSIALDAGREPGGLAVMAFALRELYDLCATRQRLDCETYHSAAFGGLSGAIARRAEETLNDLGEGSDKTLERVFIRLVRVQPGDAATRRRELISVWDQDPEARTLVDAFQRARLLVFDKGGVVEVAHEALLREWPRLAAWIEQRRDAFALAERVRTEAHAWMKGPASRHHRRPWDTEQIEEFRVRLTDAGLIHALLDDPFVARLLTPEREWMAMEIELESTPHHRRAEIGRRLAKIGDELPGSGLMGGMPALLWCSIPVGEVEIEAHGRFPVAPFNLAACPITVRQFQVFLDAPDGFQNDKWWVKGERQPLNSDWDEASTNHPVTGVSWFDASAFCQWLSAKRGEEIRLPDEWEWQWAAQSARRVFLYPWGKVWRQTAANTAESSIRGTSAVGIYPRGRSEQGAWDLSGNVWEWCRNPYKNPKVTSASDTESRVLRGGSWYFYSDLARANSRFFNAPANRIFNIGFRVVCSSPIHQHPF